MTDAELENLRELAGILREQRGQSQMAEPEEDEGEQSATSESPGPVGWEGADSPPSGAYWEPVCSGGSTHPGARDAPPEHADPPRTAGG